MLFSVVDDCSGVVYQEYRSVYGKDAESALRFLFNAFAAKPERVGAIPRRRNAAASRILPSVRLADSRSLPASARRRGRRSGRSRAGHYAG